MENLESRNVTVKTGEVSPGDVAAVIASNRELKPQPFGMLWGYHLPNGKLLFNARSETAAQKSIFADGMEHRRCAIPAAHYFEWQKTETGKTKYAIAPKESKGMLLAGIYRFEGNRPVFTILTRQGYAPLQLHARICHRLGNHLLGCRCIYAPRDDDAECFLRDTRRRI